MSSQEKEKRYYLDSEEVAALKCAVGKTGYALTINDDGSVSLERDGKIVHIKRLEK